MGRALLAVLLLLPAASARAGAADVLEVAVQQQPDARWTFRVTVRHADRDWQHYANRWEVVAPDGSVLATRRLRHPHVQEQPFTRQLRDVEIPSEVTEVSLRAHCSVHAHGGESVVVKLDRR